MTCSCSTIIPDVPFFLSFLKKKLIELSHYFNLLSKCILHLRMCSYRRGLQRLCPLNGPLAHFDIHAFINYQNIKELWVYFFSKHPTSMKQLSPISHRGLPTYVLNCKLLSPILNTSKGLEEGKNPTQQRPTVAIVKS